MKPSPTSWFRRGLASLLALMLSLSTSTLAGADKRDKRAEAKVHYDNGLRKFDLGKYDEAAEEFEAAYELVGDPPNILYNIAQAYRLAEKFEKSAQFYRSFLRKVPEVPNRAEIEGRIAEMDERAADQKRQTDRRAAEQREAERKAEQKRKTPPVVDDKPTPKGPEPPPRDPTAEDRQPVPGRTLKIVGYALCGLTGAALGLGVAMTVLTVQASNKVSDVAKTMGQFTTSLQNTEHHGQLYEKLQIVGYSVAGAAAVGAALSIYFGFRAEKQAAIEEGPVSARRRRIAWPILAPAVGAGGGGFVLGGRF